MYVVCPAIVCLNVRSKTRFAGPNKFAYSISVNIHKFVGFSIKQMLLIEPLFNLMYVLYLCLLTVSTSDGVL